MFHGFSQETLDFLWGIRFNNEKSWFEAHKEDYLNFLYRPMRDLSQQVYTALSSDYPQHGFVQKVSRIYRDARRLHGRGPYKDHLWCSIEKPSEAFASSPVFWFELTPESWSYGMGYYAARALTMEKHRARMDQNPAPMLRLAGQLSGQTEFCLDGPSYVRKKAAPDPLLAEWYNKKSFSLLHEEPLTEDLYHPELAGRLIAGYRTLMPFYEYFVTLDGDPDPRPQ